MAAYRVLVHEGTQFSPNRLMSGRENRLPADIVLGCPYDSSKYDRMDDFVDMMQECQCEDFALVREHLDKVAQRRKERYDDGLRENNFKEGQMVWYFWPQKKARPLTKVAVFLHWTTYGCPRN